MDVSKLYVAETYMTCMSKPLILQNKNPNRSIARNEKLVVAKFTSGC